MFEQRGWTRTGLIEGPAPFAPSCLEPSELLVWADRAPANGAWLDAVAAVDPECLSGADRIGLVRAWERLRRGVDAGFVAAVGLIAARPCTPEPGDPSCAGGQRCEHDWSSEDTALALGVGRMTARTLLEHSRELTQRLPGMLVEVADGRASLSAARRAADRTTNLADPVVAAVAEQIAGRAAGKTVGAFDRHVATVIDGLRDPAEVEAAHRDAVRKDTGIRPLPPMADGMAGAVLMGPAEKIAALFGWARQFTRLNRHPDDPRTVGMRRLDALLAGILDPQPGAPADSDITVSLVGSTAGASTGPVRPAASAAATGTAQTPGPAPTSPASPAGGPAPDREAPRERVALQLVLAASTLLGHDDEPGWLEGHGDLAAPLARALAVHPGTMQRLLAHPLSGELLDLTPETRVPSAALDRFVRARDGSCTGPTCGGSARHAELDHITPVRDGGPTTRANLHAVCKRSHRQRHPGGWSVRRDPGGSETWTDPHGNSYQTEPTRYPGGPIPPAPLCTGLGAETGIGTWDIAWPSRAMPNVGWPDFDRRKPARRKPAGRGRVVPNSARRARPSRSGSRSSATRGGVPGDSAPATRNSAPATRNSAPVFRNPALRNPAPRSATTRDPAPRIRSRKHTSWPSDRTTPWPDHDDLELRQPPRSAAGPDTDPAPEPPCPF